jgi:formamidopyrimidine-DNA glycosylase
MEAMIELPEAVTFVRQFNETLKGKRITEGDRGNSPHKFAFYSYEPEEYAAILGGRLIGESFEHGSCFRVSIEPDYVLQLGGGGERILYHENEETLPKKRQLLLRFEDEDYLTVSVQGWGFAKLIEKSELDMPRKSLDPLCESFTLELLAEKVREIPCNDPRSIKYFIITDPAVWGIGNGYLQDILFKAKIHPRRRVASLTDDEIGDLHLSIRDTVSEAIQKGGRDTERDLFNQPGGYVKWMDSRSVNEPCPQCGTLIEKISYLGGACYICPECQKLPS